MPVLNPKKKPFSPYHTVQQCNQCGYRGYADKWRDPMKLVCPKCGAKGDLTIK